MKTGIEVSEKKRLRKWAAETAAHLTESEKREASDKIAVQVLASPLFLRAASLFIYVSTPREPDTRPLIEAAWQAGKRVFVPQCRGQGRMDAAPVTAWAQLSPGPLGILEPAAAPTDTSFPALELAIVPCVCASRDGRRLGHGAGYYDRFLAVHPMPALCLCFGALLRDDLPAEPTDEPMDAVITETGWFGRTV